MGRRLSIQLVPVLSIAILGIVALAVKTIFAPPRGSGAWVNFHVLLISATALLGFAIWDYFFPRHPGCDLFFSVQKETDEHGNWRGYQASCLEESVGRAKVGSIHDKRPSRRWGYFCSLHDPRSAWMEAWLEEHGLVVYMETIKKLRFSSESQ